MEALPALLDEALAIADGDAAWLGEHRRQALARVRDSGLPTVRHENWKYTSLAALRDVPLRLATAADAESLGTSDLAALEPVLTSGPRVVIVNGVWRQDLSMLDGLPAGITVSTLASVDASLATTLGTLLDASSEDGFSALNTATLHSGLVIDVAADTTVREPLAILSIGTGTNPLLRSQRILIRAGRNARLRVIEQFLSSPGDGGLTNAVTNIELAEGAEVHHHRLQSEAETSAHIGRVVAAVGSNALLHSDSVAFGGSLTRVDIDVALNARGARCELNGLFAGHGEQHIDHHTRIDHVVGDTHSRERYRGILDDRSRGVFNGKVVVHKNAQGISAEQASNNLLLSREAEIDTKPELEIYADDVTCAHGATVGELDEAALFYLRSRGIPAAEARALLVFAFASETVSAIPLARLRAMIEQRFIGDNRISELLDGVNP